MKIDERIDVITIYRKEGATVFPYSLKWNGKKYVIKNFGYHHKSRIGRNVVHIFSVSTDDLAFRLRFDSESMAWILEEISDGY